MCFWGVQQQGGSGAGCSGQQRMLAGVGCRDAPRDAQDGVLGDWQGPGRPGRSPQSGDVAEGCGCGSGPSLGLRGESAQRGDLCASRKCPFTETCPRVLF